MIIAEIIESSLLNEKSSYYELSILIGVDSLVFVVFDEQKRLLALKHWQFEKFSPFRIEHYEIAFRNEPILGLEFKTVNIGIQNRRYTLIPSKFYNENRRESYLKNLVDFDKKDLVFMDRIPDEQICNVFAFPKNVFDFLKMKYPNCSIYHGTTPMLHGFSHLVKNLPGENMLVNFRPEEIDITLFKNGKLRFLNSYPISNERDNMYFILLIFEQFGLKQSSQEVFITGQIIPKSDIFRQLKRYIPKLKLLETFHDLRTGDKFKAGKNNHRYFDILSFNAYAHDSGL